MYTYVPLWRLERMREGGHRRSMCEPPPEKDVLLVFSMRWRRLFWRRGMSEELCGNVLGCVRCAVVDGVHVE